MPDPKKAQGVEPKAGDDQKPGVPPTKGTTPVEKGVPAGEGTTQAPGVPPPATMPQEQPGVKTTVPPGYVSQADMDALRASLNRRNYEMQTTLAKERQAAEEWRMKAETADMPEEDRYKYLYEQSQQRLSQVEAWQAEQSQLVQWQYYIADRLGVHPSTLNPTEGVQSMIERAAGQIERERGQPDPAKPPPSAPPVQPITPRAPSAPTSSAPTSTLSEIMSVPFTERHGIGPHTGKGKIPPRGPEFEKMMEKLDEED